MFIKYDEIELMEFFESEPIFIGDEEAGECMYVSKGQILRSTPNTAPLICGACNTQPEGLSTMA